MANLSQERRERMIAFLETLRESNKEDVSQLRAINEIEQALNEKRYGLVWEEHTENVDDLARNNVLLFQEDATKKIAVDKSLPYNFLLEGDNLHSLRLLEKTHIGKIDVIYIDPPYNTGNKDFIYNDKYIDKTDGYSHSKWLSFMSKRLEIAKRLLSDIGVIFISIDDNEQAQLKLLCNDIFGEENFLAQIIWERAHSPVNLKKHFSENHDFILVYARNKEVTISNKLQRSEKATSGYKNPDNDPRGVWASVDLSVGPAVQENIYEIITPSGRKILPTSGRSWVLNKQRFEEYRLDNRIWFGKNGDNVPRIKRFLSEVNQTVVPQTIWKYTDVDHSQTATKELKAIFDGQSLFTYPKPVKLIKQCISLYSQKNSIILDFFAGSGTTGHAVAQLNKEDGGNRKYILCTNNENNICEEVTYQRLLRIQENLPHNLKYLKAGLIEKIVDIPLADELLGHILPLVELENACDLNSSSMRVFLDEESFDDFMHTDEYKGLSKVFLASDILLSAEQERALAKVHCDVIRIPEYYYRDELIESGEV